MNAVNSYFFVFNDDDRNLIGKLFDDNSIFFFLSGKDCVEYVKR